MLRTDSIPKVTGAARYVEDMVMPGCCTARCCARRTTMRGWSR